MAMYSLRYSFTVVSQIDAPFAEETQRLSKMRDCISSMYNYVTPSRDMFNNKMNYATFFTGESDRMTFISNTPPSGRGLAICSLSLVNRDVVLEEASLYADKADYLAPSLDNGDKKSTVIVSGISSLRLEYLQSGKIKTSLKAALPSLVRIVITADGKETEYYSRILTNFDDKVNLMRGNDAPPI
jgi:hypothetical protein